MGCWFCFSMAGMSLILRPAAAPRLTSKDCGAIFHDWASRQQRTVWMLKDRITAARSPAFVAALLEHGQTDQPHRIGTFGDLLSQHGARETRREPLTLSEDAVSQLTALLRRWTDTLLSSPNSKRGQLASVASAIGRLVRAELLPQLRQLLDADLSRWRDARRMRDEARAHITIEQRSDASHSWVLQYQPVMRAASPMR
jgi:hypothetical protein